MSIINLEISYQNITKISPFDLHDLTAFSLSNLHLNSTWRHHRLARFFRSKLFSSRKKREVENYFSQHFLHQKFPWIIEVNESAKVIRKHQEGTLSHVKIKIAKIFACGALIGKLASNHFASWKIFEWKNFFGWKSPSSLVIFLAWLRNVNDR